jgi:hypothetical protein
MTNQIAALSTLSHIDCVEREGAFEYYYNKWNDNNLAMLKWFSIKSASNIANNLGIVILSIIMSYYMYFLFI